MDERQSKERELVVEALLSAMSGDIDEAGNVIDELEKVQMDCLPEEGKYRIQFAGKPRQMDITTICYRCGELVTSNGIAFVPPGVLGKSDEEFILLLHRSGKCTHWKSKLHRMYNHYVRTPFFRVRDRRLMRGK